MLLSLSPKKHFDILTGNINHSVVSQEHRHFLSLRYYARGLRKMTSVQEYATIIMFSGLCPGIYQKGVSDMKFCVELCFTVISIISATPALNLDCTLFKDANNSFMQPTNYFNVTALNLSLVSTPIFTIIL
jgi:hypothetical protein